MRIPLQDDNNAQAIKKTLQRASYTRGSNERKKMDNSNTGRSEIATEKTTTAPTVLTTEVMLFGIGLQERGAADDDIVNAMITTVIWQMTRAGLTEEEIIQRVMGILAEESEALKGAKQLMSRFTVGGI